MVNDGPDAWGPPDPHAFQRGGALATTAEMAVGLGFGSLAMKMGGGVVRSNEGSTTSHLAQTGAAGVPGVD